MVDYQELRNLFDRAVAVPAPDRTAFLEGACAGNTVLRDEVARLLAADARFGTVFDTVPAGDGSDSSRPAVRAHSASLAPGTRLGPYVITSHLGTGGMGEVYKAHDARLDRTVALKVLPPELTGDSAARQRFEREARSVAALSHPHICALFDIGYQDGTDFLVMECVDGETLATRLARGRLPTHDVLTYAGEIAEALAAAHRAGIVHRDLKPANIMVTRDGIKLLDFGLAKRRPSAADAATGHQSAPLTQRGLILGTVHYMSPEQLEGSDVDERTDIFAFGVVLYEMMTGRRAFEGGSDAAVIGNILHAEPPSPSSIEPLTPAVVSEIVRRCLEKDPSARWASMADVHSHLVQARELVVPAPPKWVGIRWRDLMIAGVATASAVALLWWVRIPPRTAQPRTGDAAVQRSLTRLTFDAGLQTDPAFSPDGRFITYASDRSGNFDIWIQQMSGEEAVQVTKSAAQDTQPSWSPDGSTIAFRSERDGGGLYVVPALGGMERLLVPFGSHPSWSPDGAEVWFQTNMFDVGATKLHAVSMGGGPSRELLPEFTGSGGWAWIGPHPDGRVSFLGVHRKLGYGFFTVAKDGRVTASDISRLPGPLTDIVHSGGQRFQWNRDGTALILETETNTGVQNLWRVRVDPATLNWISVERLTTGAGRDVSGAVSPDGRRVAFSTQRVSERLWRFAFDPGARRLFDGRPLTEDGAWALAPDITADGKVAVLDLMRPGSEASTAGSGFGVINLWLTHFDTGRSALFATNATHAVWSPDARQVAYLKLNPATMNERTGSQATALAVRQLDGAERIISPWSTAWKTASDWVSDGSAILVCADGHLLAWPVNEPGATRPSRVVLAGRDATLDQAKFSPDGRWLIFATGRSAMSAVGVTSADGPPDRQWLPLTPHFLWADNPRWAPDGKRIYFLASRPGSMLNLWGVEFDSQTGHPVGEPFAITHFDSPALTISPKVISFPGMNVSSRQAFLTMSAAAGNIWTLDNVDR